MAAIYKLQVRITKYLMCMYGVHMCVCVSNMKFLCLTLCQGEVCTDTANTNDTGRQQCRTLTMQDANDDGQCMIV